MRYCPRCNKEVDGKDIDLAVRTALIGKMREPRCPGCAGPVLSEFYELQSDKHREIAGRYGRGERFIYMPPPLAVYVPEFLKDGGVKVAEAAKSYGNAFRKIKKKLGRPRKAP